MPRNKVGMTLIEDRKKRKVTFKNRSDGLIEKARQLTILTGCDALCICYEARRDQASRGAATKTWPADHEKVQNMIQRYRGMPADRSRQVLTPLTFNEEELNKEQRKVVRVQQCGPGELGPWDTSSDGELKVPAAVGAVDRKKYPRVNCTNQSISHWSLRFPPSVILLQPSYRILLQKPNICT
jgi:hypothetical protein